MSNWHKIKILKQDKLFADAIKYRDNWTCQRCKKKFNEHDKILHCSHYFSRSMWSVRFSETNCITLCAGCHNYFHKFQEEYRIFKIKQLKGENNFNKLLLQAHNTCKKNKSLEILKAETLLKFYKQKYQEVL